MNPISYLNVTSLKWDQVSPLQVPLSRTFSNLRNCCYSNKGTTLWMSTLTVCMHPQAVILAKLQYSSAISTNALTTSKTAASYEIMKWDFTARVRKLEQKVYHFDGVYGTHDCWLSNTWMLWRWKSKQIMNVQNWRWPDKGGKCHHIKVQI